MTNTSTSSKFTPSRSEAGVEVNPLRSGVPIPAKSFIVGRYDEYGGKKTAGKLAAEPHEVSAIKQEILKDMSYARGSKLMPGFVMTENGPVKESSLPVIQPSTIVKKLNKKSAKNIKVTPITASLPVQTLPTTEPDRFKETFTIVFSIESGNIRSTVDAILEDNIAVILVYESADKVSYVPKNGGKLTLVFPDKRKIPVMFLGAQLQWYDTDQQLLIFVKTDIKE